MKISLVKIHSIKNPLLKKTVYLKTHEFKKNIQSVRTDDYLS